MNFIDWLDAQPGPYDTIVVLLIIVSVVAFGWLAIKAWKALIQPKRLPSIFIDEYGEDYSERGG